MFSSAVKLFGPMCRYCKFKLFGGSSAISVAEPFITSGLISLVG